MLFALAISLTRLLAPKGACVNAARFGAGNILVLRRGKPLRAIESFAAKNSATSRCEFHLAGEFRGRLCNRSMRDKLSPVNRCDGTTTSEYAA